MSNIVRSYTELLRFVTFEDRFEYLKLTSNVGKATFGFDRYLNQQFYRSALWRRARDVVIVRDRGCDLGIPGYEIPGNIRVHHMNPLSVNDIEQGGEILFDPEFLICTSTDTHTFLHFGTAPPPQTTFVIRTPGDMIPWR